MNLLVFFSQKFLIHSLTLRFEKSHNLLITLLTLRALATRSFELLQLDRRATANSPSRRSNTFSHRSMQGRPVFEQDDEASIDPILLSCTLLANLAVKYELRSLTFQLSQTTSRYHDQQARWTKLLL